MLPNYWGIIACLIRHNNNHTNLWIHNAFLFETTEKHVHGVDFAPQVAVVLSIVSSDQVTETGRHVGTCRKTNLCHHVEMVSANSY